MTFNQYKDAKSLFAAIEIIFGGNEATKKTQKTILKQMYENFSAPSTESLDSIFNRLFKLKDISRRTVHVEKIIFKAMVDIDGVDFDWSYMAEDELQALVDGKKVVITEAYIRHDLKLNDAEGSSCLSNAVVFEELARMGYEKPSKKLTFYKAFFSPQWKFFIHTIIQRLSAKTTS
nr:hypothetical protein [Tanacetum cinerariifolium]